jgi:hypothetical protein
MMTSNMGGFSESAVAALAASSMMKSMQQNSFIQAPIASYSNAVPLNIQDRDLRALEMSMNALAVTDLLMSRGSLPSFGGQNNAYGSMVPSVPSTSNTSFRRPLQQEPPMSGSTMSGSTMNRPAPATMASNIWGVPEESTLMEMSDNGSDNEMEQIERGNVNDDLPPNAFNV